MTALDALIADYIASNPPGCESVRDRIAAALAERGELVDCLKSTESWVFQRADFDKKNDAMLVSYIRALLSKHQA